MKILSMTVLFLGFIGLFTGCSTSISQTGSSSGANVSGYVDTSVQKHL